MTAFKSAEREYAVVVPLVRAYLTEYRVRGFGNESSKQNSAYSYCFKEIVYYGFKSFLCFVRLCERPRCCFVNVLVGAAEHCEYVSAGVGNMEGVHVFAEFLHAFRCCGFKLSVGSFVSVRCGDNAAEVFLSHSDCAVYEVAEVVRKVRVVSADNGFVCDGTVGSVGHFGESIVTHAVNTELLRELVRIDNVSAGF